MTSPTEREEAHTEGPPDVTVVMLAFGPEPFLAEAVDAVLRSRAVTVEVIIVDNGSTSPVCEAPTEDRPLRVVRPPNNLGFAAGANLGASHGRGRVIAFVNSDAIVDPDCLRLLHEHVANPAVAVAGALVVLADQPGIINSAGNPLHALGLSWAGMLGRRVDEAPDVRVVPSASGAAMAIRRETWARLAGFGTDYFAYFEDMDLCWRAWQGGLEVHVVSRARCSHHYEFSRHPSKMYLLERNRWLFLLTTFQWRTLAVLAIPLFLLELALLIVAIRGGWWRAKVRSWWWLATHAFLIGSRRAWVQGQRRVPDRELFGLLSTAVDPAAMSLPPGSRVLERLFAEYWGRASRIL